MVGYTHVRGPSVGPFFVILLGVIDLGSYGMYKQPTTQPDHISLDFVYFLGRGRVAARGLYRSRLPRNPRSIDRLIPGVTVVTP